MIPWLFKTPFLGPYGSLTATTIPDAQEIRLNQRLAVDPLQGMTPPAISLTLIVQILLKVLVNLAPSIFVASVLPSVIVISKVMSLTAIQEIETVRKIAQGVETWTVQHRNRAAVIVPVKGWRIAFALGLKELGHGGVKEETVGLTLLATLRVSSLKRKGKGERRNRKSSKERKRMHTELLGLGWFCKKMLFVGSRELCSSYRQEVNGNLMAETDDGNLEWNSSVSRDSIEEYCFGM